LYVPLSQLRARDIRPTPMALPVAVLPAYERLNLQPRASGSRKPRIENAGVGFLLSYLAPLPIHRHPRSSNRQKSRSQIIWTMRRDPPRQLHCRSASWPPSCSHSPWVPTIMQCIGSPSDALPAPATTALNRTRESSTLSMVSIQPRSLRSCLANGGSTSIQVNDRHIPLASSI